MEQEVWNDIPNYEGEYKASSYGRIKSMKNGRYGVGKERILKERRTEYSDRLGKDRPKIVLFKNGIRNDRQVSRIIASVFLGLDIDNSDILVCHKDDNTYNNRLDNLFLGTAKDNVQDCINKGRRWRQ